MASRKPTCNCVLRIALFLVAFLFIEKVMEENDGVVLAELKQLAHLVHQVLNDNQAIKRTCGEIKLENETLRRENVALKRRLAKISEKLHLEVEEEDDYLLKSSRNLRTDIPQASREVDAAAQRIIELHQQNTILLEENRELKMRLNLDPNARLQPIPTSRRTSNPNWFQRRWRGFKSFFGATTST